MKLRFLICFFILFSKYSFGQGYEFEYEIIFSGDDVRFYGDIYYTTSLKSEPQLLYGFYQLQPKYNPNKPYSIKTVTGQKSISINDGYINSITINNGKVQVCGIVTWNTPSSGDKTFTFDYTNIFPYFEYHNEFLYKAKFWSSLSPYGYGIEYNFKFYPNFKSTTSSDTDSLYFYDKVNISFTKGFPLSAYKGKGRWQWRIGDGGWNDIPSCLINDNEPHCISVCGKDLINENEIREYAGKYIHFRINNLVKTCCETV
ncbi:MAG: hypothetical protein IKI28_10235, partial [Bacteroidales bacterium]|nr:hypothetical protein [Bacteroidales bacterium]